MADNSDNGSLTTASRISVLALVLIAGIPLAMNQWRIMSVGRAQAASRQAHLSEAARHVVTGRYDLAAVGYRKASTAMVTDSATSRAADHLLVLNSVRNPQTLVGQNLKEMEYIVELALNRPQPPPHAHYYLGARGAVRAVQGRIEDALSDFDKAIAADDSFAPAHYFRGKVLADTARPKEAQPSLEKAIALDARLVVAHKRLARLLIDGGELDGAATRLKAVLDDKVLANDPEAHYLMGVVRDKQQDYQAALERFMSAFRINPKYPRLKRALGVTMFKLKRYRDAVQILSKVYEATREINTYYFIGRSLMELKDYQKAANIFQAIISNRPSHAEARFDLATLLDNGNQGQAAGAHYSAFLQILQKAGRKDMTIQARTAKDRIEALRVGAGGK